MELRGLGTADIPAWNRLLADVERVDRTGEHYNEADLAEEMANPDIDPATDLVGAFAGDEMVGYFGVYPRSGAEELHKIQMEGAVRPDLRGCGIGSRLAAAMKDRALAAHQERYPRLPAALMVRGLSANTAQADLMRGIGMLPERWSFVMRAELATVPGVATVLPDGLELHTYDPSYAGPMLAAHNAAFLDHPNSAPWSEVMWKQWVTESRSFRPDLSLVVTDPAVPGQVAAYLQTNEYDAYFETTGRREAFVAKVGTRREYRGRGLAGSILAHALGEYRRAGYDEACLDVDSENPTGALGIYLRAGFEVESRWTDYGCTVGPGRGLR